MEVTKKQASKILGISPSEVIRQIEAGKLQARRKTESKFSDWLITLNGEPARRMTSAGEPNLETQIMKELADKPMKEMENPEEETNEEIETNESKEENYDTKLLSNGRSKRTVRRIPARVKGEGKLPDLPAEAEEAPKATNGWWF